MKFKALQITTRICSRECENYNSCEDKIFNNVYTNSHCSLAQRDNNGVMSPTKSCPIYIDFKNVEVEIDTEKCSTLTVERNDDK